MPTTTSKGYSVQVAGSNAGVWGAGNPGSDLNTGCFSVIDTNLAGVTSYSLASSNVVMSATECQSCLFRLTGVLLANIILTQAGGALFNGFYYFENYTSGNFTVTLTTATGSIILPQSRGGVVFVDATNAPRILSIVGKTNADPIPVGTVMLFYQNAAPTGWTISSALNDYALKIVSSAGGVASGSVTYSTLFSRTATDGYSLLVGDLAAHTHSSGTYWWGATGTTVSPNSGNPIGVNSIQNALTQSTGSGNAHSHAIDMRVQTASIILCSKN